ncbi:Uroporphyrinogen decarboxylase (URO-D) [Sporobacter termitidis DSM 10068]|uniref:Uroporphyrinogen decarboxylase (URO-D) n=1 Tax=Sporobacter termitidis DSM 10068 TaxID=1123282 RepID=A0A1M5XVF5_9FIRM|nr:uroporphyrinogen decarboxylase family protein [Sporobacter termitidis]SHI03702.1 Uroporphyrinogen decarboxylase (URO-D) [Sporobacter termitidis DSM 10068]
MNPKEQFLSALKNEKPPKWMGYAFNAYASNGFPVIWDPVTMLDAAFSGESYIDLWGATWRHLPTDPGAIPMVNQENKVIKDLTHWRDYVRFPSLDNLDWSAAMGMLSVVDRDTTLVMVPSFYGPFERAHALMPFDEVLCALYEEPDATYDLFGALTDWKIKALGLVIDHIKPDIIHSHDDWGSKTSLFMSPEIFRKLLKPHYTRLYSYIKSRGVLVQHHADCYCQGLECDMVDMGIDMWQGVIPANDIPLIQRNTRGRLLLLGGIDQTVIDHADATEESIRAEVRRAIDTYAPGGAFLPCIASILCINEGVGDIVIDECNKYGAEWLKKNS